MKHGNAPLQSIRLLDQVRERIRYMHYSLSTEKTYLYRVKFFVRWYGRILLNFAQERCIEDNEISHVIQRKSI